MRGAKNKIGLDMHYHDILIYIYARWILQEGLGAKGSSMPSRYSTNNLVRQVIKLTDNLDGTQFKNVNYDGTLINGHRLRQSRWVWCF